MYNIERFREAHRLYIDVALREIRSEIKMSDWIWFIFPQLRVFGRSQKSVYYGMENAEEARMFYDDEYLGANLREICKALLECKSNDAYAIMGSPDNMKLYSSMTLFYIATGDKLFSDVLDKFYGGKPDELTVLFLK